MSSTVPIPFDQVDEEAVIGTACASLIGAHLEGQRLRPEAFYMPQARRAFEVAISPEAAAIKTFDARLAMISTRAEVDERWLRSCIDQRPTFVDQAGTQAALVAYAARRRRLMAWASAIHEAAGEGHLDDLERLLAESSQHVA